MNNRSPEKRKKAMFFAWYVVHNGYYLRYGRWRKKKSDEKFTIQDIFFRFEKWERNKRKK